MVTYKPYLKISPRNKSQKCAAVLLTALLMASMLTLLIAEASSTGDLRVRSYTSNSGHLTADTILFMMQITTNLTELRIVKVTRFLTKPWNGDRREIYEDEKMVADDQDTVTAGEHTDGEPHANAKVTSKSSIPSGSDFPGATVKLYNHAGLFGTKTADSNGEVEWSVYPPTQSGEYYYLEVYDGSQKVGQRNQFSITSSTTYSITTTASAPAQNR